MALRKVLPRVPSGASDPQLRLFEEELLRKLLLSGSPGQYTAPLVGSASRLVENVASENPLEDLAGFLERGVGRRGGVTPTPRFLEENALAAAAKADPRIAAVIQEFEDAEQATRLERRTLQEGLAKQGELSFKDVRSLEQDLLEDTFDEVKDPKVRAFLQDQLREEMEFKSRTQREIPRPQLPSPYERADSPSGMLTSASDPRRTPTPEDRLLGQASRNLRQGSMEFRSGGERWALVPSREEGYFTLRRWTKAGNQKDFGAKKITKQQLKDLGAYFGADVAFMQSRLSPDGTTLRLKATGLLGGDKPSVMATGFREAMRPSSSTRKSRKERLTEQAQRRIKIAPNQPVEKSEGGLRTDLPKERVREALIPTYRKAVEKVDAPAEVRVGGKKVSSAKAAKSVGKNMEAYQGLAKRLAKGGGPLAVLALAVLAGTAMMGSDREAA